MIYCDVDKNPILFGERYALVRSVNAAPVGTVFIPRGVSPYGTIVCEWENPKDADPSDYGSVAHDCGRFFNRPIGYYIPHDRLRRLEDPDDGIYEGDHWL